MASDHETSEQYHKRVNASLTSTYYERIGVQKNMVTLATWEQWDICKSTYADIYYLTKYFPDNKIDRVIAMGKKEFEGIQKLFDSASIEELAKELIK